MLSAHVAGTRSRMSEAKREKGREGERREEGLERLTGNHMVSQQHLGMSRHTRL